MVTTLRKDYKRKFYRLRLRKRIRARYVEILEKFRRNRTKKSSWRGFQRWMVGRSLRNEANTVKWWCFKGVSLENCQWTHSVFAAYSRIIESLRSPLLKKFGKKDLTKEMYFRLVKSGIHTTQSLSLYPDEPSKDKKFWTFFESLKIQCVCKLSEEAKIRKEKEHQRMQFEQETEEMANNCGSCILFRIYLTRDLVPDVKRFLSQSCTDENCSNFRKNVSDAEISPLGRGIVESDLCENLSHFIKTPQLYGVARGEMKYTTLNSNLRNIKIRPSNWLIYKFLERASGFYSKETFERRLAREEPSYFHSYYSIEAIPKPVRRYPVKPKYEYSPKWDNVKVPGGIVPDWTQREFRNPEAYIRKDPVERVLDHDIPFFSSLSKDYRDTLTNSGRGRFMDGGFKGYMDSDSDLSRNFKETYHNRNKIPKPDTANTRGFMYSGHDRETHPVTCLCYSCQRADLQ